METHNTEMTRKKPLQNNCEYVGRGWKAIFICPDCGKETWQHLNFLGSRKVFCRNGKIVKE